MSHGHFLFLAAQFQTPLFKRTSFTDLPSGPVVVTVLPMQGEWIPSLVKELRSHKLCIVAKKKKKAHYFLLGILSSHWMCLWDSDQDSSTPSLMGREMAQARTGTCSLPGIWILTGGSKKQERILFPPSLLEPAFRLPAGLWILSSRSILIPAYFQASILLLILWTPNILPKYCFSFN